MPEARYCLGNEGWFEIVETAVIMVVSSNIESM
jgi:hypothetical protein